MAPRNEKNTAQIPTIRIHSRGDLGSVLTAPPFCVVSFCRMSCDVAPVDVMAQKHFGRRRTLSGR
jgi:hypothetical protein